MTPADIPHITLPPIPTEYAWAAGGVFVIGLVDTLYVLVMWGAGLCAMLHKRWVTRTW